MAKNYPVWARSLVEPESFENEQIRLGQVWTLLGVPTDVAKTATGFELSLAVACSDLVTTCADLRTFVRTVFTSCLFLSTRTPVAWEVMHLGTLL